MATPFNNPYDPFNQRVRGYTSSQPGGYQAQPIASASYPQQPAQPATGPTAGWPTGAYPTPTPAPVYQGPPNPSSGQPPPGVASGWPQAQQQQAQPPQQTVPPRSSYPNTGVVPPAYPQPQYPLGPQYPNGGVVPPSYPQQPAPQAHPTAMPGWDQGKWSDPNKHDAKYDAGHLMSTLAPSVANIPIVLGMLQQNGHQVQYQGGDTAIIDGYTVDLVRGSHSEAPAWQWMVPQSAPSPEQGMAPGGVDPYTQYFTQLMAQMQSQPQPMPQQAPAAGGVDQSALLQSILQLLQQQAQAPRGPVAPNFSFY